MIVFISQPMRGKTDSEIMKEREACIEMVSAAFDESVSVIDSFFRDATVEVKPLWFLGRSLELLACADVAVFAPGWENARGCRIEHECCKQYGIKTMYLEG